MKKIKLENRFEENFFKTFPSIARRSVRKGYDGVIALSADDRLLEYDPLFGNRFVPTVTLSMAEAKKKGYFPLHSVKALVRFAHKHDYLPAGTYFVMFCEDDFSLRSVQTWTATLTE